MTGKFLAGGVVGMEFTALGVAGRDCPVCFRVGSLFGERSNGAELECSGCRARFTLTRGILGAPDALSRKRTAANERAVLLRPAGT